MIYDDHLNTSLSEPVPLPSRCNQWGTSWCLIIRGGEGVTLSVMFDTWRGGPVCNARYVRKGDPIYYVRYLERGTSSVNVRL